MGDVAEKIKRLRNQKGLTQRELARLLHVAPTAISAWERGANYPLMDKLVMLANLFEVPVSHFFEGEEFDSDDDTVLLPVYEKISCGGGRVSYDTVIEFTKVPKTWITGGDYFLIRAEGDSMQGARIYDGDLLFIRKQDTVDDGEIAAVVVDDMVMLKRVYRNNGSFTLISDNPKYPPLRFDPDTDSNIRIIGKLKRAIIEY